VHHVENISWNDTSKLSEENWSVRAPGPSREFRPCHVMRFTRGWCGMATPLGVPVEPEV
jgi:hypothetical protein